MENERVQLKLTVELVLSLDPAVLDRGDIDDMDGVELFNNDLIAIDFVNLIEGVYIGADGEEQIVDLEPDVFQDGIKEFLGSLKERA